MQRTIISQRVWKGSQSWDCEEILMVESAPFATSSQTTACSSHKLRVRIKRDSYDFQSYGKVERWDGTKWQFVLGVTIGELKANEFNSYAQTPRTMRDFAPDCMKLVETAMKIVS